MRRVLRHARDAVRREALRVGVDQRARGRGRHRGIRAGAGKRARREVVQCFERDRGHGRSPVLCRADGSAGGRTRASAAATFSAISVDTRAFDSARDAGDVRREQQVRTAGERRSGRRAAPARRRRARRRPGGRTAAPRRRAASSTTPPRAVLIRIAPGFIRASRAASIRCRVAATSGTCSVTTSASASSASSPRGCRALLAPHGGRRRRSARSNPITRMPSARPSRAASRPMPPKPTTPSVLPASSRPLDSAGARPFAAADRRRRRVRAAQQEHGGADHVLGDRQRVGAGGRNHLDPRARCRRRRRCCRGRRPACRRP